MSERKMTRRQFLEASAGVAALAATGCATHARVAGSSAGVRSGLPRLEIGAPSRFRILQLTDIHFFCGRTAPWTILNERTEKDMGKLVSRAKPDIVVITGDLWRDNPSENLETYMRYGVARCEELGVPWAFAWGNHDRLNDFSVGHKALAGAKNSLYGGSDSDGNYVVDIVDRHQKTVCQVICLNSKREGLGASQQWMCELAEKSGQGTVPRFAFFHIPLKQYAPMWADGSTRGFKAEAPCTEEEDGSSLVSLKQLGVKACFCGHDHVSDYSGIVDGVELVYGRATGYGGYGQADLPKGGKLITVDCRTGRYDWETVLPDGKRWRPAPGERILRQKTT